ncbi:hypothetical protein ACP4OV_027286 [Aristida adscensionis]
MDRNVEPISSMFSLESLDKEDSIPTPRPVVARMATGVERRVGMVGSGRPHPNRAWGGAAVYTERTLMPGHVKMVHEAVSCKADGLVVINRTLVATQFMADEATYEAFLQYHTNTLALIRPLATAAVSS